MSLVKLSNGKTVYFAEVSADFEEAVGVATIAIDVVAIVTFLSGILCAIATESQQAQTRRNRPHT